jgi:thiaminase
MKEDGVPPNIHTYTSYINACCKAGDMQVLNVALLCLFDLQLIVTAFWRQTDKDITI